MSDEFPTFAEGDILLHLRFVPGFEPETIPLGNTGLALHVQENEDETLHILIVK